jgi:hypothetical protein
VSDLAPSNDEKPSGYGVAALFFATPVILFYLGPALNSYQWSQVAIRWMGTILGNFLESPAVSHMSDQDFLGTLTIFSIVWIVALRNCWGLYTAVAWFDGISSAFVWGVPWLRMKAFPVIASCSHTFAAKASPTLGRFWHAFATTISGLLASLWRALGDLAALISGQTWFATAGICVLVFGVLVCKWAHQNRGRPTLGWLAIVVAMAEAVSASFDHLKEGESLKGRSLYLTTLFLTGFTVMHHLAELGTHLPFARAGSAASRSRSWPPSIRG